MKTFYVATLARYVLVDARDETEARTLGHDALHDLYTGRSLMLSIPPDQIAIETEADQ